MVIMNNHLTPPGPPDSRVVTMDDAQLFDVVESVLVAGQCVVVPTDTVYGIAALADDRQAVARLQQAKARSDAFPPPVLVADAADAWLTASSTPAYARALGEALWPGALTLILPSVREELSLVGAVGSIGLRVPDHGQLRALLRHTGPLAVSSANRQDQAPATTMEEARAQLGDAVALYVDGGQTPGPLASTVVDCCGAKPVVRRVGRLTRDQIMSVVGVADA
jgi:tRNA threonylcarbamoyl adenosine modification protein (Sua5/YciO/YrdC/YwlC family)